MKNINRVVISGNLTRDPELRRTQGGMAILTIGVACNDSRKNQQTGEWEDIANFIDCTMFGNRAESIANYLRKGTKVLIEGKLRYSSWQDKDTGKNRSKLEVLIDEIEFINTQGQQNGQRQGYQQPQQYAQPAPQQYAQQPPMQQGYYAPPTAQPQQPMQPQYAQPAPQQYQQPQTAPQAAPQPAQAAQMPPAQQQMDYDTSVYDDDIPF